MTRMFIDQLEVAGVGCVHDLRVRLFPLHAFIGPNDSGKSTLLRAIESVLVRASSGRNGVVLGHFMSGSGDERRVRLFLSPVGYQAEHRLGTGGSTFRIRAMDTEWSDWDPVYDESTLEPPADSPLRPLYDWLQKGARFVRWEADALRKQSPLIPDDEVARSPDERGRGLAGVYDLIFNRGDEARDELQTELRRLFPTVKGLRLRNVSEKEKALELQLTSGAKVSAEAMSEGMLYYLAFAAIRYLDPPSVILIEEPENGLHPARIADVMGILREISKTTQVIVATHSPLVVNELKPGEVTVITRDLQRGTQAHALQETPNFEERSKVYDLGELWLSYANGDDEAPLLAPTEEGE